MARIMSSVYFSAFERAPCKGAAGQAVASEMAQRLRTESKYIDETVVEYQTVNVCNGGV